MNNALLEEWRKKIDELDKQLLEILAKRIDIVRKIGSIKKEQGARPLDKKRWQEVLSSTLSKAATLNLSRNLVKKLYILIHDYSLEIEKEGK